MLFIRALRHFFISVLVFHSAPSAASEIVHLPQLHWVGSAEDGATDFLDQITDSQLEIIKYVRAHPSILIYLEGQPLDLGPSSRSEQSGYSKEPMSNAEAAKNAFPHGIPRFTKEMTIEQKKFLALNGGPETLLYLGEINELKAGEIDLEKYSDSLAKVEALKREMNYDELAAEFHSLYQRLVFDERDSAVFQRAKADLSLPANKYKKAIIVFGANHDFSRFNSVDLPVRREDFGPAFEVQRLASLKGSRPEGFKLPPQAALEFWSEVRFASEATVVQTNLAIEEQRNILAKIKLSNKKIPAGAVSALLTDDLKIESLQLVDPDSISLAFDHLTPKQFLKMISEPSGQPPSDPVKNQKLVLKARAWLRDNANPQRTSSERKSYEDRIIAFAAVDSSTTTESRKQSIKVQEIFLTRLEDGDQQISEEAWNAILDLEIKKRWHDRVEGRKSNLGTSKQVERLLNLNLDLIPLICDQK